MQGRWSEGAEGARLLTEAMVEGQRQALEVLPRERASSRAHRWCGAEPLGRGVRCARHQAGQVREGARLLADAVREYRRAS